VLGCMCIWHHLRTRCTERCTSLLHPSSRTLLLLWPTLAACCLKHFAALVHSPTMLPQERTTAHVDGPWSISYGGEAVLGIQLMPLA
jgi:hypothetical protein